MIGGAAEALLYAAARAQLVDQVILPALARGEVVVADRFIDSSLAYQGVARGLGLEQVLQANQLATGGLMPDITLLLELPAELAAARRGDSPRPHRVRGRPLPRGGGARASQAAPSGFPSASAWWTRPALRARCWRACARRRACERPVRRPAAAVRGAAAADAALADPGHAYLLSGPPGTGKRRYAERLRGRAARDAAAAAIETRAHPDLFVLEAEGGSILIDHARELRRDLHMRPFEADRRVY